MCVCAHQKKIHSNEKKLKPINRQTNMLTQRERKRERDEEWDKSYQCGMRRDLLLSTTTNGKNLQAEQIRKIVCFPRGLRCDQLIEAIDWSLFVVVVIVINVPFLIDSIQINFTLLQFEFNALEYLDWIKFVIPKWHLGRA